MVYLVDTNVLLRLADRRHPLHPVIRQAIRKLQQEGHTLQITAQNAVEFWNVVTRPANKNGFGLTPPEANRLLRLIERLFPLLPDSPSVYPQWRQLVVQFGVSGVQVHDARLTAAMLAHQITHILTFNGVDFSRYTPVGIVAVDPATV